MTERTSTTIPRARLVVRIVQFPPIRIILGIACVALGVVIAQLLIALLRQALNLHSPLPAPFVIFEVVLAVSAVYLAYAAYVHWIERRPVAELSGRAALPETGLGVLCGTGLLALIVLVLWVVGSYHVTGINAPSVLLAAFAADVPSAVIQQVIFQGIIFRIAEESLGTHWALVLTVALFGALHLLLVPQMTVAGLFAILLGGLLFAAAYLRTRRLWLPSALHASLDFAQDGIFGIGAYRLSAAAAPGIIQAHLSGPAVLTGGTFGAEASLVTMLALLAGAAILLRVRLLYRRAA